MKKLLGLLICFVLVGCNQNMDLSNDYEENEEKVFYGMKVPKNRPDLFMQGIVSTGHFEHSAITFLDKETILYSRIDHPLKRDSIHNIMVYGFKKDLSSVDVVEWSNETSEDSPFVYDEKVYYHMKTDGKYHLYYYDSVTQEKVLIEVDTEQSLSYPCARENLFLFNMATSSKPESKIMYLGSDLKPYEFLSASENEYLNINPFLNKEEDMLLYGSVNREDGKGACDLYVSFKSKDGIWCDGINLELVNTDSNERFPSLSPDGDILFFVSNRSLKENVGVEGKTQNGLGDFYWIDASFIYDLNPYKSN